MPGRPWQSKGCRTCRQRKIKCDQKEPACARCIKLGVQCPGYQNTHFFIASQETFRQRETKPRALGHRNVWISDSFEHRNVRTNIVPLIHINASAAKRDQVFSSYLQNYFPSDCRGSAHTVDLWAYFIESFSMLTKQSELLEKAIAAVSCVYLGKIKQDDQIFFYGLELYNRAIQCMSSMIRRNIYTVDLVYATVIFQEMTNCYCPDGYPTWLAHIFGTNAIIENYRQKGMDNPLMNAIYDQWQKLRIISFTMGRDLTSEEYEFCREPCEGRPIVELINICAEYTPLYAEFAAIDQSDNEACQKLLENCLAQENRLLEWYALRKECIGGGPFIATEGFHCPDIDPVNAMFGDAYNFSSLDNGMLHVLYWMAMTTIPPMVYRARVMLESSEHIDRPVNDYLSDAGYRKTELYADNIVRSIPFFAHKPNKLWGVHMVMFGPVSACKVYVNLGIYEKFCWCQNAIGHLGDRGFGSMKQLRGYLWEYWNPGNQYYADPFLPISLKEDQRIRNASRKPNRSLR